MKWVKAGEVPGKDTVRRILVDGKKLCLVQYEGKVYVVSARCPHAGGDLSAGWCKDGKLICPLHRFSYDLETGRGSPGQHDFIPVYPVEVRDNQVYIGLSSFWERLRNMFTS